MKLTMVKRELVNALNAVADSISRRSTLPVLSHVKIEVNEQGEALFQATDLEIATTFFATAIVEPGVCTTEHKIFLALAKNLPEGIVTLSYEDGVLNVSAGKMTAPLEATDASEYPTIPTQLQGEELVVDVTEFKKLVKHVAPAAAKDDSRPVLTAVLLEWKNDVLTLVAADAFRLAMDCMMKPGGWPISPLIPVRSIVLAMKRMSKAGSLTITHGAQRSQISFECGQVRVTSRLIEGNYPNFRTIVPQDEDTKASALVDTNELLAAINGVYPAAKDASDITPFHLYPKSEEEAARLSISAQNEQMKEPIVFPIEAEVNGEEMEVLLNNRYAHGLLAVLEQPQVLLQFRKPSSPCKITVPERPTYVGVVMAMHITNR